MENPLKEISRLALAKQSLKLNFLNVVNKLAKKNGFLPTSFDVKVNFFTCNETYLFVVEILTDPPTTDDDWEQVKNAFFQSEFCREFISSDYDKYPEIPESEKGAFFDALVEFYNEKSVSQGIIIFIFVDKNKNAEVRIFSRIKNKNDEKLKLFILLAKEENLIKIIDRAFERAIKAFPNLEGKN